MIFQINENDPGKTICISLRPRGLGWEGYQGRLDRNFWVLQFDLMGLLEEFAGRTGTACIFFDGGPQLDVFEVVAPFALLGEV